MRGAGPRRLLRALVAEWQAALRLARRRRHRRERRSSLRRGGAAMIAEGDLLTIPQVQRLLPLARSTIYALIDTGRLPAYRVQAAGGGRGRVLVAKADLEAFVAGTRQAATRAPTVPDADALLAKVRARAGKATPQDHAGQRFTT